MKKIYLIILLTLYSCSHQNQLQDELRNILEFKPVEKDYTIQELGYNMMYISSSERVPTLEKYFGKSNISTWFYGAEGALENYEIQIHTLGSHYATTSAEISLKRLRRNKSIFMLEDIKFRERVGNYLFFKIHHTDIKRIQASFVATINEKDKIQKVYLLKKGYTKKNPLDGSYLIIDKEKNEVYYQK